MMDGTPPSFNNNATTTIWTWDGNEWKAVNGENAPAARYASCAAYDTKRGVVVSFGGRSGKEEMVTNDTWEWNGDSWRSVASPRMPARDHHALCFDERSGFTVLFGGGVFPRVAGPWATDTWRWNGSDWNQIGTTGPPGRVSTMVYDSWRESIVLFGGVGEPEPLNGRQPKYGDTWLFKENVWTKLNADGPPPRSRHAMAFDSRAGKVLLYGGENDSGNLGDMWEWDGDKWSQIKLQQPNPGERRVHAMAYDEARNVTVLYGGMNNKELKTDTWEWNGEGWRKVD